MKFTEMFKHTGIVLVSALALMSAAAPAVSASSNRIHSQADSSIVSNGRGRVSHRIQRVHSGYRYRPVSTRATKYNKMYRVAKSKLGHRYVYGAVGPRVFDCSGFTQYVYRHGANKTLPRTAQAQYNAYRHVRHAEKGDLVFFGHSRYSISHVGMVIGKNRMIDAQDRGVVTENIHAPWWHKVGLARPMTSLHR